MNTLRLSLKCGMLSRRTGNICFLLCVRSKFSTRPGCSMIETSIGSQDNSSSNLLKDDTVIPQANLPTSNDIELLYRFFDKSRKLVVLTGAGISTESGIPDYRSPKGAYSTGYKPITYKEFVQSVQTRKRYWARSYAGWKRFAAAEPNEAHKALASLEKGGWISFMITQNVDRLHHRAGSDPLELHGSVYSVVCLQCGHSVSQEAIRNRVKALNPKWALAIETLERGSSGSDKRFGMKQRPDADIEINEKFWKEGFCIPSCTDCTGLLKPDFILRFADSIHELITYILCNLHITGNDSVTAFNSGHYQLKLVSSGPDKTFGMKQRPDADIEIGEKFWKEDFCIPNCTECNGILKPDVVLFGDNVPRERVDRAKEAARGCDAFLVLGSSLMTMSAFRLVRTAHESGARIGIVNVGETRADDLATLKINARCGEILPRLPEMERFAVRDV